MDCKPPQQVDKPRPELPRPETAFKEITSQIAFYQSAGYGMAIGSSEDSAGFVEILASNGISILFLMVFDGSGKYSKVLSSNLVELAIKWLKAQRIQVAVPVYIRQVLTCLVAFLQKSVNNERIFAGMVSTCNITAIVESQQFAMVAHLGDSPTIIINRHTGELTAATVDDNGQSPRAAELIATGNAIYNYPYFEEVKLNKNGVLVTTGSKNMSCALITGPDAGKDGWLQTPVISLFPIAEGNCILLLTDGSFEYWKMSLVKKEDGTYARKNNFIGDKELGLSRIANDLHHCCTERITDPVAILNYLHESHLTHATQIHADYLKTLSSDELGASVLSTIDTPEKFNLQFDRQADNRTILLFMAKE